MNASGHGVDGVHVLRRNDRVLLDVAEEGYLVLERRRQELLRPAQQDIRLDADLPQLLDAVLGRLRLHLPRRLDKRHKGEVDEERILLAQVVPELADRLEEGEALDIAHRAAYLHDHDVDPLIDVRGSSTLSRR